MSDWKYVMFLDERTGQKVPVIFPGVLVHADVAEMINAMKIYDSSGIWRRRMLRPINAGHIPSLQILDVEGRSETLNMGSNPEDTHTINMMPYEHGMDSVRLPTMAKLLLSRFCELALEKLK